MDINEFMVMKLLSLGKLEQEDVDEMRDMFEELDVDRSGCITKDDLVGTGH